MSHIWILVFVSIPGLIFWAFGIPFYALIELMKFNGGVEDSKINSNPSVHTGMADRFGLRFGFLSSGYQNKYYYWEVFLILRKTVIVLLITFMAPVSSGVQSLSTISVLIAYRILHQRIQPFYDKKLNDLESYSLTVLLITIYFGLFYQASKDSEFVQSDGLKWAVFSLVFLSSFIFLMHFLF